MELKPKGLYKKIGQALWLHCEGRTFTVDLKKQSSTKNQHSTHDNSHDGLIRSPMPGKILKIQVKESEKVKKGQTLCILEAMKMEYSLKAPFDGTVKKIFRNINDQVAHDEMLLEISGDKNP